MLGEGGFGSVFKGWIDENTFTATKPGTGMVIAVKRLNQDGYLGHREWLAEVKYLGQLYHPNLVKLVGYCFEEEQRLLVYEFMSKGSLENHLFRRGAYFHPLSWNLRLKVAYGAAKGLAFLHKTKVIFRDFKTANILIDVDYNAKLSDFGLAKDGPTGEMSHVSTRIMGTHGYAAPEYLATGHLTEKSDVYSFGVALLEILTGRRAVDKNRPTGEHKLVEWAKPFLNNKRKFNHILDKRIQEQMGGAQKACVLASKCLCSEARYRPTMNEVVQTLEQIHSTTNTRNLQATESGSSKQNIRAPSPRAVANNSKDVPAGGNRRPIETAKGYVTKYPRPSKSPLYTS